MDKYLPEPDEDERYLRFHVLMVFGDDSSFVSLAFALHDGAQKLANTR